MINKIQILSIKLSDGREFNFTGKAIYDDENAPEEIVITEISISPPVNLPEDYKIVKLPEIIGENK
jgi:hypothetical protein